MAGQATQPWETTIRIFTAGISTETNTFAPWPTGERGFREGGLFHGNASALGNGGHNLVARHFRDRAAADGHDFIESLFAAAQPSGPTTRPVYEKYRDQILGDLRAALPVDVVLLALHGAMVADGYDDCEADLVGRVRELCGPKTAIGVELDLHCHVSAELVAHSTAVILFKEYPHTDFVERASELYDICTGAASARLRPTSALFDCRMIGFYPTTSEPMAGFVRFMHEVEQRPGVLSVSFVHGFPWGDTADTGSKVLAITDDDEPLAARVAEEVGYKIYDARNALLPRYPGIAEALDIAAVTPGRVVLADTADNAGGGAPSDNVSLLRAMLERGCTDAVLGVIWDPIAVQVCMEAGLGAQFALRLGGKSGPASGTPLDLQVTVEGIVQKHSQAWAGGARVPLGPSVWLRSKGIDIAVCSIRFQTLAPDAFSGLGIDLENKRVIAVKSSHHFHLFFAPLADRIISVATPGALQMDFAKIAYIKRRDLNFFPRVGDPLG